MIRLEHVNFGYDNKSMQLHDINIDFGKSGQSIGLVGPNGSGKSTLFKNIVGLEKPTSGQIFFDDKPIKYNNKSLRELRTKLGMVFQNSDNQIFYPNVQEDVAFVLRNLKLDEATIKERLDWVFKSLDIEDLRDRPVQYLSGGQKKRVAIAGVLVMKPEWILMDEPTAGLDFDGKERMKDLIRQLIQSGQHLIISSHDMNFMYEICDYFYVLSDGKIITEGKKEQVFEDDQAIQEAKLEVPFVVRLHRELGFPLYENQEQLYADANLKNYVSGYGE
ncbi:energy-coupling factor ABC transporter ATP-binding protein [Companilactobacillus sp.]|jgi:cobalt/nickel transport system ATP-binding protein|uniref:energy-coupling factor ABC transporter ATP-binding protein n=1 Tax=Companilactobacillus sp. TaxID=2767905 RepID=UPI0025C7110A|nr:ABC transporter ATP-binding protein [Companilactobacillus sp.]MCH4008614.1 energy-coupling factor ABC transporter ATP-binding protein [Companilactobacillus sp.]MCH4051207.1 energy-coupling factor ABC transporter ATP-binding protein [Companilactobacillus sp.]MCH4076557.1 energy-coupling factor ABC transporter ATP-binding protein [Companilactobacillus sp.]MCH4125132.1 energy-coupling factor ABC transporter ATP-binding protein [Companilactobacillus sp.]MCH4131672.1 energy-coupling factor ABC t